MIRCENLTKKFGKISAVNNITFQIDREQVFGLIGTNGAGKSTLLRMITGVLKPDEGSILVEDKPVWENPEAKEHFCFISDDPWYFPNATPEDMGRYFETVYRFFDSRRFYKLLSDFELDRKKRISQFSKGMKRQLAILLGLCAGTDYLLLDETFDGLDPVVRQGIKSLFAGDMSERGLTPVISSHNMRELEDICDHVGFLHKGGLIFSEDLVEMKLGIQKIQCVFQKEEDAALIEDLMKVMNHDVRGKLHTYVVRGEAQDVKEQFGKFSLVFFEMLPLTLEEIFIAESEAIGYDTRKIIVS